MSSQPLSDAQKEAINIFPRVTAAMSVLGSASIMYSILSRHYNKHRNNNNNNNNNNGNRRNSNNTNFSTRRKNASMVGENLLLGMCIADLISSMMYVIGGVAFPVEKGGKGNQATCNAQGFFANIQVGAALYSGFLAWYYCLFIRYRWKPERLHRIYEPCAHALSWLFVIGTGITAIVKDLYHPHWIRCYISGPNTNIFFWFFFFVPIWASMFCGTIAMLLIYSQVRKVEARSVNHTFQRQSMIQHYFSTDTLASAATTTPKGAVLAPVPAVPPPSVPAPQPESSGAAIRTTSARIQSDGSIITYTNTDNKNGGEFLSSSIRYDRQEEEDDDEEEKQSSQHITTNVQQQKRKSKTSLSDLPRTRRVAYQGLCYAATFLLVYVFPTTSRTWTTVRDDPPPYAIRLLAVSFVGSQGFFNWLIYCIQPRIYDWLSARQREKQRLAAEKAGGAAPGSKDSSYTSTTWGNGITSANKSSHVVVSRASSASAHLSRFEEEEEDGEEKEEPQPDDDNDNDIDEEGGAPSSRTLNATNTTKINSTTTTIPATTTAAAAAAATSATTTS